MRVKYLARPFKDHHDFSAEDIAALEKNQPHLVNFNSLADLESSEGSAYFYAIPNSQDLQADEIFPNANGNNGAGFGGGGSRSRGGGGTGGH